MRHARKRLTLLTVVVAQTCFRALPANPCIGKTWPTWTLLSSLSCPYSCTRPCVHAPPMTANQPHTRRRPTAPATALSIHFTTMPAHQLDRPLHKGHINNPKHMLSWLLLNHIAQLPAHATRWPIPTTLHTDLLHPVAHRTIPYLNKL